MNNKSLHTRVIVVGDVHGEYEKFRDILYHAKLTDLDENWTGGNAILAQTGDMIDRGPKSIESVEYIRSLQEQAKEAGGKVVRLFGNHELMLLQGDYRYANFQRREQLARKLRNDIVDRKLQAA